MEAKKTSTCSSTLMTSSQSQRQSRRRSPSRSPRAGAKAPGGTKPVGAVNHLHHRTGSEQFSSTDFQESLSQTSVSRRWLAREKIVHRCYSTSTSSMRGRGRSMRRRMADGIVAGRHEFCVVCGFILEFSYVSRQSVSFLDSRHGSSSSLGHRQATED